MKQVVALLGSKRKKNTFRLLSEIQTILKNHEIELHIIELCHRNITPCAGCERCILQGQCMLDDDAGDIMKRLSEADGIVLASPVYLKQVSGQLKTFFDRTCMWYHRPVLAEKPVLSVSTTKGSGLRQTLSYLKSIAIQWGAVPAGMVGRTIFTQNRPVSEKEISGFIRLVHCPQNHSPSLNQLINFEVQKALAMAMNPLDREYWQEKQWQNKPYFYPCRINKFYSVMSLAFGKFLQDKMNSSGKKIDNNFSM